MAPELLTELSRTARAVHTAAAAATVAIGRGRRGAGIVIAPGQVLTNAHNLRDRTTSVAFADGRAVQATVAGLDPDGDLAVLTVDTAGAPVVDWAETGAALGDVVFALAATNGGTRVTVGFVSIIGRSFRGPRGRRIAGSVEHTAPLARGSSGGPLLDGDGRLVGINTHRLRDGFTLAIPADADLRARVERLAAGDVPATRRLGVAVAPAEVARRLRRAVGLPDRAGLLVRGVEDGSPAAAAGLLAGDLLVRAGDHDLLAADDLFSALDAVASDGTLVILVVRGTEEHTVSVTFG